MGVLITALLAMWAVVGQTRRVRRLELRARAAERLAELGTLTGGLAHEIKNPLSTIGLNSQLLSEDLDELATRVEQDPKAIDKIGRIQRRFGTLTREVERLRHILEDFLRFAGRVRLEREMTDVNALIDELGDFFTPQADAAQVHLRTELAANPATIMVDPSLLKQALLNLMVNAAQIMREARESQQPTGGATELMIHTTRQRVVGEDQLVIHVIDTGPGIPADRIDKIFAPYFSTRKGGTGLGLPTTRRIIEEHGGTITVHSESGRGTDFTIMLPADRSEHPS